MEWIPIREYDVIVVGGGPSGASTAINCANRNLDVLLLERYSEGKSKPCGGVLPWITSETVEDIIDVKMPESVYSTPRELGLYYVPPSGKSNSGRVQGYKIHNIDRTKFDSWMVDIARKAGVEISYDSKFLDFISPNEIRYETNDGAVQAKCRYLVGADGVRSRVRQCIKSDFETSTLIVGQEYWRNDKLHDIEDCFYGFFRDDISIAYAYVIPKGNDIIIGLGVPQKSSPNISEALDIFRIWLADEFAFAPSKLTAKEAWSIPFGYFIPGAGNVLLVGDAAGLCNPLSGEGIRLGIESGEAACTAILAGTKGEDVVSIYKREVDGIAKMVSSLHDMIISWGNHERELFVKEELSRGLKGKN